MNTTRFSPKTLVQKIGRYPSRLGRRLSEKRFYAYLAILGPGLIAANAGNDASGIATYATAGAISSGLHFRAPAFVSSAVIGLWPSPTS